jgi:hypothetical protein
MRTISDFRKKLKSDPETVVTMHACKDETEGKS